MDIINALTMNDKGISACNILTVKRYFVAIILIIHCFKIQYCHERRYVYEQ